MNKKTVIAYRWADTEQDRPRHRLTLDYNVTPDFQPGLEYNFAVQELGIRATWTVQRETESRPVIFFNTSSDRIGTPEGYQLVSVNFGKEIPGTEVSPYVTVAYSGFEKGLVYPFGASAHLAEQWTVTAMNDGRKSHLLLTFAAEEYYVQAGWIWLKRPALTIGWGF